RYEAGVVLWYMARLGVHAASESSAAYDEFTPLDLCFHREVPDLYAHLEQVAHPLFPHVNAATWLTGHGEGETVHAGYAFNAAAEAIRSQDANGEEELLGAFLWGFGEFYRERHQFFATIAG